jgi:menaquinone-9 beta-reductase
VSSTARAEVVVVGGGPAGAVSAMLLARAGHDVLLLDRARFPRPKPCGDCVSAGAAAVLERIGLLDRVLALPGARLRGWRITAPDGTSFSAPIPDPPGFALAIERRELDAALLAAAAAAGVRVHEGVRVHDISRSGSGRVNGVISARGTVHANLVVGADGLRSVVARRLGAVLRPPRLRKLSLTFHVQAETLDPEVGEMHSAAGVCAGVAPVRADLWNLTVVASGSLRRAVAANPRAFVAATLDTLPRLRGRVPRRALERSELLSSGPFDQPVRRVVFDGAVLAGDAAGYYDPFTGQGVCHALLGAELLAAAVAGPLGAGDCSAARLAPYGRALRRMLRGPRMIQHGIEAVLSRPAAANLAIARLAHATVAARTLIAVIGHTMPAAALWSPGTLHDLIRPAHAREIP